MSPDAGVAVRLKLLAHRQFVAPHLASLLARRGDTIGDAGQRLYVMPHLVGDDVGSREVTRRAEALGELLEERQVEVDLAVARTVERTHCGLAHTARRLGGIGEQDEHWRLVAAHAVH